MLNGRGERNVVCFLVLGEVFTNFYSRKKWSRVPVVTRMRRETLRADEINIAHCLNVKSG